MSTSKNTPRDFFLYLFATVALYVSAINVIALLWQYVNYFYPEAYYGYFEGFSAPMRVAVATLIILFPTYVFVMRFLNRDVDRNPEKRELWIRRWLIYLTLFISAVTIVVDLVSLVYNFLGGDFAVRFGLKALSVLVVAGIVFWYYLFTLRRKPGTAQKERNLMVWVSLTVVAALVIGAFFLIGSPATNRMRQADSQRVWDLENIQSEVTTYWQQKEKLPSSLKDLNDPLTGYVAPTDPDSGADYEYRSTGTLSFELCATFALPSAEMTDTVVAKPVSAPYEYETPTYWNHSAGRACFSRTIDPDRYPPFSKPVR